MNRRWWNTSELRRLKELRADNRTREEIAAELGRTPASVKAQIERGSIPKPAKPVCDCCRRPL